MNTKLFLSLLLLVSAPCALCADTPAVSDFNKLVDQYFDFYFSFHPTEGTASGLHQYDSKLEDFSAAAQQKEVTGLKDLLAKFKAIDSAKLPADTATDLEWIISSIHSNLLELEAIQMWRKDPDHYSAGVTKSIFVIMQRNYAPVEDRLRSAIERERQIPKALETVRHNLQSPPKVYAEIALEQLPDDIDFFRKDVPDAFSAATDPKLVAEFKIANQAVIAALESYQKYFHDSVLPHADGDFPLGADNYRNKLLYD